MLLLLVGLAVIAAGCVLIAGFPDRYVVAFTTPLFMGGFYMLAFTAGELHRRSDEPSDETDPVDHRPSS